MTTKNKRVWHHAFKKYMKFIINHPNYKGMPFLFKNNGEIRWITSGKSEIGKARYNWWNKKRKSLKMPQDTAWISKVARAIHPTGEKPCQICGKVMKLDYIYPNKRGGFSPGAMSNAPDRLDGFHSYNLCCRSKQDTGRHKENLSKYGEDRRAYENWAEGDWKAASWLMKEFNKNKVSADHLGPISLGFMHRPKFRPLSREENSARNNRMTFEDIKLLLLEEKAGDKIISSHSKYLWNMLKTKIKNDSDALKLSKIMRQNMHNILSVFAFISEKGYQDFLIKNFLYPEHANYSISFKNFNPKDGSFESMIKTAGDKKQYKNNTKRYIRISIDSLKKYIGKENRHNKDWRTEEIDIELNKIIKHLEKNQEKLALKNVYALFKTISFNLAKNF